MQYLAAKIMNKKKFVPLFLRPKIDDDKEKEGEFIFSLGGWGGKL